MKYNEPCVTCGDNYKSHVMDRNSAKDLAKKKFDEEKKPYGLYRDESGNWQTGPYEIVRLYFHVEEVIF